MYIYYYKVFLPEGVHYSSAVCQDDEFETIRKEWEQKCIPMDVMLYLSIDIEDGYAGELSDGVYDVCDYKNPFHDILAITKLVVAMEKEHLLKVL